MELSPQQIRAIGFKLVKKGYDPDQVDSFKDEIASVVETAHKQAIAMEARARAAVAKLHEVSQSAPVPERASESFSASDNDVITRTLALAQRTADTAVAEARDEADAIIAQSRDEAERLLDNARTLATKTIEDSRADARRAVEGDRVRAENELQSLLARRDFLLSDVDHLEQYLQAQRERLRDAAMALQELVDRVPAGLGEIRRPLLSASADPVVAESHRESTPVASRRAAHVADEVIEDVADGDDDENDDDDDDDVAPFDRAPFDRADEPVEEMSELVWDDESIAAAERASELPFRPSAAPAARPGSVRPSANARRSGVSSPPFNDPLEQDSVWRMLDEEVASAQTAEGGDITTEVPIVPRATETFRVGGDELQ